MHRYLGYGIKNIIRQTFYLLFYYHQGYGPIEHIIGYNRLTPLMFLKNGPMITLNQNSHQTVTRKRVSAIVALLVDSTFPIYDNFDC